MKLRFFCDQCGTEVPRSTERCPSCGRYFTAVQCPRCGFQGRDSDFLGGCPTCGYMRKPQAVEPGGVPGAAPAGRQRRRGPGAGAARRRPKRQQPVPAGPPPRTYRLIGLMLAGLLLVLLVVLFLRYY